MLWYPDELVDTQSPLTEHPLNDGVVLWLLGAEPTTGGRQLYDIVGTNHGIFTGSPSWVNTQFGRGVKATAGTQLLTLTGNPLKGFAAFGIESSVITGGTTGFGTGTIFDSYDNGIGDGVTFALDGNSAAKWQCDKRIGYVHGTSISNVAAAVNTAYHLLATCTAAGLVSLYVNGVLQTTTGTSAGAFANTNNGLVASGTDSARTLVLTSLRLYNRCPSALEAFALYEQSRRNYPELLQYIRPWSFGVTIVSGGGDGTVSPDNIIHGHTSSSPALTQTHILTPANASHGHTASSPTLTQIHILTPAGAAHSHSTASPSLTEIPLTHPASLAHAHIASSPSITQTHVLVIANASHAHLAGSPAITQTHILTPTDTNHSHSTSSPILTQTHVIIAASLVHGHSLSSPILSGAGEIIPENCFSSHTASSPSLGQIHVIGIASTLHEHAIITPAISQIGIIVPANNNHEYISGSPSIFSIHSVSPTSLLHGHLLTSPSVTHIHIISPINATHLQVSTQPTLSQIHLLHLNDVFHLHSIATPTIIPGGLPIDGKLLITLSAFASSIELAPSLPRIDLTVK